MSSSASIQNKDSGIISAPSMEFIPDALFPYMRQNIRMTDEAEKNEVYLRVQSILDAKDITEREASVGATGKPDLVRTLKSGRKPNYDAMVRLASYIDCSVQWLLTGVRTPDDNFALPDDSALDTVGHIRAPEMVAGSMEQVSWAIPSNYITNDLQKDTESLAVFTITDDSMSPTFVVREKLIADLTDVDVTSPGVFLVRERFGLMARRINPIPGSTDAVKLKTDNPVHDDYEINVADIELVGRVISSIRQVA